MDTRRPGHRTDRPQDKKRTTTFRMIMCDTRNSNERAFSQGPLPNKSKRNCSRTARAPNLKGPRQRHTTRRTKGNSHRGNKFAASKCVGQIQKILMVTSQLAIVFPSRASRQVRTPIGRRLRLKFQLKEVQKENKMGHCEHQIVIPTDKKYYFLVEFFTKLHKN